MSQARFRRKPWRVDWFDPEEARAGNGPHLGRSPNNVPRFLYPRVTQRDGHMAWTSPIWLDFYCGE